MPNKLSQFWQELKRRKVIRVITVYAAAAFVIIELVDIVAPNLGLPTWTFNFVLILLLVGFVITVIISWIYDIHPEGGIIKTEPVDKLKDEDIPKSSNSWKIASYISFVVIVAMACILLYPKIFRKDRLETIRDEEGIISVAVLPFQNMTSDTTWNIWQDGIKDELITHLTNSEELKVRQAESIDYLIQSKELTSYASITPSMANTLSRDLDADVYINGSIKRAGDKIRVNAQIFDLKTKETLKSFQIDAQYSEDNILNITDSLSVIVSNYLIISVLEKEQDSYIRSFPSTDSPEAYRKFMQAKNASLAGDAPTAREYYLDAIKIDSSFIAAMVSLTWSYENDRIYDQAKKWCLELYAKRDQMTTYDAAKINFIYTWLFETPRESIVAARQLLEIDDQDPSSYRVLGQSYSRLYEYENAIPYYEKALEIYQKWDSKPDNSRYYHMLGTAFHETGQYRKEKKLYRKAEKDFPDDYALRFYQAILALSEGKTKAANEYIEKFIYLCRERSMPEEEITYYLGEIYRRAKLFDEAEEYYRDALKIAPESAEVLNLLAWFLIDTERNIPEGLELVEKALEISPDHPSYIDTKGWGLYLLGNYQEAHDILQKGWDLRKENSIYSHGSFLHLEAAREAVEAGIQ